MNKKIVFNLKFIILRIIYSFATLKKIEENNRDEEIIEEILEHND